MFVEDETATRTLVWSKFGTASTVAASWIRATVDVSAWSGQTIRIVVQATDGGHDSLIEAGIDDVRVERPT